MNHQVKVLVITGIAVYLVGVAGNAEFIQQNLPVTVELITVVFHQLHANCLYILHNMEADLSEHLVMNELLKTTGKSLTSIMALPMRDDAIFPHKFMCSPLYVILSANYYSHQFLLKISKNSNFHQTKWLIFTNDMNYEKLFTGVYVPISCEFVVSVWLNTSVYLKEVYHLHPEMPIQHYNIGTHTSNKRNAFWPSGHYFELRKNLQNISIRAVTATVRDKKSGKLTGFYGEVWSLLQEKMNFREDFQTARDCDSYGAQQQNGTWNGMMGMLLRREADIAVGGFALTPERMTAVEFLVPLIEGSVTVYIRRPDLDTFSASWLLAPFDHRLWLTLVIIIIGISLELSVTWRMACKWRPSSPQNSVWLFIFGSFCQQGQPMIIHSASSRVLYFTSYMTAVITLAAYSATFTSFLTVQRTTLPFTSFEGLLEDGTYSLGMLARSATLNYFDKSNNEFMGLIYRKLIASEKESLPESNVDGLHQICKRKHYAYLVPVITANIEMPHLHCRIIPVPGTRIPASSSMVISKQSPYRRVINQWLQHIRRAGILRRIQESTLSSGVVDAEEALHNEVLFESIAPLLIILTTGKLIAILICLTEFIKIHVQNR